MSSHNARERCNDFSIGIELEGTDTLAYTDQQYETLKYLTACLRARYPLAAVRGHCDIAPGRKTDPGPAFDWARYAKLANWAAEAEHEDFGVIDVQGLIMQVLGHDEEHRASLLQAEVGQ